ncbi:ClpXP protease specificity-enhancing factor [Ideonella livida]|uniref:ClpXP protease specificity-enhancing factor n=1 Tax=Ideonella livida TaxID=2707176 RepID=A0A7C9PEI8_9BURK|nr:ClpXP protease specificity-enhancing factor [Ideonella livida]NDY89648.1 ClpXP protease specificity-enhancing factor [Ideonella livida]
MTKSSLPPVVEGSSTRPYLVRALHDWCTDNGFTPYLAVHVDETVRVPPEYVRNHEIVLNVGFEATSGLKLGNEYIEFRARFGGVPRDIVVPVDHVVAIYARENGQGMAFPYPSAQEETEAAGKPGVVLQLAATDGRAVEAPAASEAVPEAAAPKVTGGEEPPSPPPAPPAGPRPALKRVK